MKEYIGRKLRELRLAKNYTQQAVAKDLQLSKSTISEIEKGTHNLSLDLLQRFVDYFTIELTDILPPPST